MFTVFEIRVLFLNRLTFLMLETLKYLTTDAFKWDEISLKIEV